MPLNDDQRWLDAAARLSARGAPAARPNPSVGAIVVRDGTVLARGWTQPGGRPHAEAVALAAAGEAAHGATLYVSLEPCAHQSTRGPACAGLIAGSGLARVVIGCGDPDPRTAGKGVAAIRAAGITVEQISSPACAASLAGYLCRTTLARPHITLKLALSADGALARPPGESQWLTGEAARAHVHAVRARMDAIVVGAGTVAADNPRLDVRLPGLEQRSPQRWLLSGHAAPHGWQVMARPDDVFAMGDVQYLMVEGGAQTARAFLHAGLVDRLILYRAPITIGTGVPSLPELTHQALATADSGWRLCDQRQLGNDALEVYERSLCSPE